MSWRLKNAYSTAGTQAPYLKFEITKNFVFFINEMKNSFRLAFASCVFLQNFC